MAPMAGVEPGGRPGAMTKDELRAKLSAAEKRNGRVRYERSLIDAVMAHASPRKAAGESLSKVAEDLGMSAGNLQRWFWTQGKTAQGVGTKEGLGRPTAVDPRSPLAFVRLEPTGPTPTGGESLEILLTGVTVRVPAGFDGATLSRVLALVKGGVS